MNSQTILQCCLVLHIAGFTAMAGMILADLMIHQRINKCLDHDKPKAIAMIDSAAGFPRLIGIGAAVLVLTGIGMVIIFKGAVASMLWFRIKMILVVLVMVNGSLIPRQQTGKLRVLLSSPGSYDGDRIAVLKSRLGIFHAIQLLLFLIIFILSIFKF